LNKNSFYNISDEILTDNIQGEFENDYNICFINDIIIKKLNNEKYNLIPKLEYNLKSLKKIYETPQTKIEKEKTHQNILKTEKEIYEIKNSIKINNYILDTKDLILKYKNLCDIVNTVFIDETEKENMFQNNKNKNRIKIIEDYLEIASNYIQLNITRKVYFKKDSCLNCGFDLKNVYVDENGCKKCPDCNEEYIGVIKNQNNDISKTNYYSNYVENESIENFLRVFMRYQGLQPDHPSKNLYEKLDNYFKLQGVKSSEEIKKMPLNKKGRKNGTNHKMLLNSLSAIKENDFYEDVNLIGHEYWGWELPNVLHLKEQIISHYNKTQKVYYQIPPEERERISSLGTQYRLWRHLQLLGHKCSMNEFKIAENQDSFRKHNKLWKIMCDRAGDDSIYYIP
jgi:hypothetical protein